MSKTSREVSVIFKILKESIKPAPDPSLNLVLTVSPLSVQWVMELINVTANLFANSLSNGGCDMVFDSLTLSACLNSLLANWLKMFMVLRCGSMGRDTGYKDYLIFLLLLLLYIVSPSMRIFQDLKLKPPAMFVNIRPIYFF